MALKRVQWQQKTVDGNDIIVPNAIANADETSSGFTQDENGVLKAGEEIVCKKKLIWSGNASITTSSGDTYKEVNIGENIPFLTNWEKYEVCGYTRSGSQNYYFSFTAFSNSMNWVSEGFGLLNVYINRTSETTAENVELLRYVLYYGGSIRFYKPDVASSFNVMTFVVTRIYKIIDVE